jgi:O-antigen ligase
MLATLGLVFIHLLVDKNFQFVKSPLNGWVIAFLGLLLLSTAAGILYGRTEYSRGIREFRFLSYFLLFFSITTLINRKRQLKFLMESIIWLATIVALAMSLQFALGVSLPFLPERVEALRTGETIYTDITRILPPGQSIIVSALIFLICALIINPNKKNKWINLLQTALIGFSVLITFTRSFWVQVGLAIVILAVITRRKEKQQLVRYGILAIVVGAVLIIISYVNPGNRFSRLTIATIDRLATLFEVDTLAEDSLEWRTVENSYVWDQVKEHPLLGLGLGAKYRPWDERIDYEERTWFDARFYIHNSHYWILLKGGALSYLCLMILSGIFLYRGFKYWQLIEDEEMRGWVLGCTLVYCGILVGAIFNPIYNQWYWTPLIGIMLGVNEAVIHKQLDEVSAGETDEG